MSLIKNLEGSVCLHHNMWVKVKFGKRTSNRLSFQMAVVRLLIFTPVLLGVFHIRPCQSQNSNTLRYNVPEEKPAGLHVGDISSDHSSTGPYFYVNTPEWFNVEPSGLITTKKPLDREDHSEHQFVAVPSLDLENPVTIQITVTDENDNAPQFPRSVIYLEFSEAVDIGSSRTLDSATDPDLGTNSVVGYSIINGNTGESFRIDTRPAPGNEDILQLDLVVNRQLDREWISHYDIVIEAFDGGTPPLKGYLNVTIDILDINDNVPVLAETEFEVTLPETFEVGSLVLQVNATDRDAGANGVVIFRIWEETDPTETFRIDSVTGEIFLNKQLNAEATQIFRIIVSVTDNGTTPSSDELAYVLINVENNVQHPPTMTILFTSGDSTPKISEAAAIGDFVARISVDDPDSSAEEVHVEVIGGDGQFDLMSRDNVIYLICVAEPLDREEIDSYDLVIRATDQSTPPLIAEEAFTLIVEDVNDNPPVFLNIPYITTKSESSVNGTLVLRATATDRDIGLNAELRYTIVNVNDAFVDWFTIDSESGIITTVKLLDRELASEVVLTIMASDMGTPSMNSITNLTVNIMDVNDNSPAFLVDSYDTNIPEDFAEGNCFYQVQANDADLTSAGHVTYSIEAVPGLAYPYQFSVERSTGNICTTQGLDRDDGVTSFEFRVRATDEGGLYSVVTVTVSLIDINDNRPEFYPERVAVDIYDYSQEGTEVTTVTAEDRDSGVFGTITYRIESGNADGAFRIIPSSGDIIVSGPLDRSVTNVYTLEVSATDGGGQSSLANAQVTISIIGPDDPRPVFLQSRYAFDISEDASRLDVVGTVQARNADEGNLSPVHYLIQSGDPNGFFGLNRSTGAITVKSSLDREMQPYVQLIVQAASGSPPTYASVQVAITILDVNDNAPSFQTSVAFTHIDENTMIGSVVFIASATDPDAGENGDIRYQLVDNPGEFFSITPVSGKVKLVRDVNYDEQKKLTIIIRAYDLGSPEMDTNLTFSIYITDVNNHGPQFNPTSYQVTVSEEMRIAERILQVMATDGDSGSNAEITYTLSASAASSRFGIFPDTGWIYLHHRLDYELEVEYLLEVVATDRGEDPKSTTAVVHVIVTDVNDNSPLFEREIYTFTAEEDWSAGSEIGTVLARDHDSGENGHVEYTMSTDGPFLIGSSSGVITTTSTLDFEEKASYRLVVTATDNGNPPLSSSVTAFLQVNDMNDNAPVFVHSGTYTASVREEEPTETFVARILASDADSGDYGTVTYSIVPAVPEFQINSSTGLITTARVLDRETRGRYTLRVRASDGGNPPRIASTSVDVKIIDSNDNEPLVAGGNYTFSVDEGISPGSTIGRIAAFDPDAGQNGRLYYSIVEGNMYGMFSINRTTGLLLNIRDVDYELAASHQLKVLVEDQGSIRPRSVEVYVTINVIDANDNAPVFPINPVYIAVVENAPIGSIIWTFRAQDADSGAYGTIRYRLSPEQEQLRIDPISGVLSTTALVDREVTEEFRFVVVAEDQATGMLQRRTDASVVCIVADENDNTPRFTSRSVTHIMEDEPIGYPVIHVTAEDGDAGINGRIVYRIVQGNEDGKFALGSDTGLLTIAHSLDHEHRQRYNLNITAQDQGHVPRGSWQVLEVYVEDVNDQPPVFDRLAYVFNVTEEQNAGSIVGRVMAVDMDSGINGELTYEFPEGITSSQFQIDSSTGVIRTITRLDREEQDMYSLTVYVMDGAFPAHYDVTTVTVYVRDINDNRPTFASDEYSLTLPEAQPPGVVHVVVAFDPDMPSIGGIIYEISGGNIGSSFDLDAQSGELSTIIRLDRETTPSYDLTISAIDSEDSSLRSTMVIHINVSDANDNDPVFDRPFYEAEIAENVDIGTSVVRVLATDRDIGSNGAIRYSIEERVERLFSVDAETGEITTTGTFDFEGEDTHTFHVRATDQGAFAPRSEQVMVTVTITDVNDNTPVFTESPIRATLSVGTAASQVVVTLQAEDKDSGSNGEVNFRFSQPNANFVISNGLVTTSRTLDQEMFYRLEVEAFDSGVPSLKSTAMLEVWVTDMQPYTLTFTQQSYRATVSESAEPGSTVQVVTIENAPTGIQFTIASGDSRGAFRISTTGEDNGVATIMVEDSSTLDYEAQREIALIIEAEGPSDGGRAFPLYGYTTVVVTLSDANDNAPHFAQDRYSTSVMEGSETGTFVTQVSAVDADEGTNADISYYIISGSSNKFAVDATTGVVTTNGALDRESNDLYRLTIEGRDNGNPRRNDTVMVKITINDVNDNRPTLPINESVSISEGLEIGSLVTTIEAEDPDVDPTITYAFAPGGNPGSMFNMDTYSGRITLAEPLDRERQSSYVLRVTAADGVHTAEASLEVNVLDENDNAPVFTEQSYQVTVPELTERGHTVIKVNATDEDIGDNAVITYSMGLQPNQGFSIDPMTGEITTEQRVEYNVAQPLIQLVITATDGGMPPLSQVVAVRIQVLDVNNNAPVFTLPIYMGEVSEDAPEDTPVVTVTATDNDAHFANKKIDYSIVSGNEDNRFYISRDSGDVRVYSPLDREMKEVYSLLVMATDRGSPQRNSTAEVIIEVTDVNDHAPVFSPAEYSGQISEGAAVGDRVLQVNTFDLDKDENGKVNYDIMSGDDYGFFAIDRRSGWITVKSSLDHEKVPSVKLIVIASDRALNSSSSTVAVFINITDVNDNRPYFPVMMYLERLPENTPPGPVFTAEARDKDDGTFGQLQYSITGGSGQDFFTIDPDTGVVSSLREFDYETEDSYILIIRAADQGQEDDQVQAQVSITGVDEYAPIFENVNYNFVVSAEAQIGDTIGRVSAVDEDAGPDGVVLYAFQDEQEHFDIKETTGVITLKTILNTNTQRAKRAADNYPFIIIARSGKPNSMETRVAASIKVDAAGFSSLIVILMGTAFFVLIVVVVCFFVALLKMKRRDDKDDDTKLDAGSPKRYDATFDRHVEMGRGGIMNPNITENQMLRAGFSPRAVYRVPPTNSSMEVGHKTDISDQSHSASSGRGSVTVEDEEICQINERTVPRQPRDILDSGIQPDHEDGSCRNSASDINSPRGKPFSTSVESMHVFGEEGGGEAGGQIGHLIYAQLDETITDEDIAIVEGTKVFGYNNEGHPSMGGSLGSIVNSEEEFSGSYNWDYLLDWGPQFQPLADVFAEIAKLKDDTFVPKKPETRQFHQKAFQPINKTYPPPLITDRVQGQIKQLNPSSVERKNAMNQPHLTNNLPRSPINYDNASIPSAVTPDLSPSLSPLAPGTLSPLVTSTGVSSTQSSRPNSGSKTFADPRGTQGKRMVTFMPLNTHADEVQI